MKRLLLLLMTVLATIKVNAQNEGTAFKDGENFLTQYTAISAYYEATADGNINIEVAGDYLEVKHNGNLLQYTSQIASGNKFIYNVENVKTGDMITFTSAFLMNDVTVTITPLGAEGVMPVKLINVSPEDCTLFTWSRNGQITLLFNMAVYAKAAKIIFADGEENASNLHAGGAYLSCDIATQLTAALKSGRISEGDPFSVRFEGIADASNSANLYNGDGIAELNYTAPKVQTELVSTSFGNSIKSYYAADDMDGIFTLTFNDDLLTDPKKQCSAVLTFGNIDLDADNLYYRENLPVIVEGNTLSVDLRNKIRTVRSMLSGDIGSVNTDIYDLDIEHITITFSGVVDANGNYVSSPGQGTIGSFTYMFRLIMPDLTNFICEVVPQSSTAKPLSVKSGDKIEFWYSDANLFTLGTPGGFSFSYGEGETAVTDSLLYNYLLPEYDESIEDYIYVPSTGGTDLITVGEVDEYGGRSIWLTIPELPVANGTLVKVAPVGIVTVDGVDHCAEYAQTYIYDDPSNGIDNVIADGDKKNLRYNLSGQQIGSEEKGIIVSKGKVKAIR